MEAPARKKSRLTQEKIHRILSWEMDDDPLPDGMRDLKRRNPDLIPSQEEEMDEEMMELYDEARLRRGIMEYHAWVRNQSLKLPAIAFREARGYS